MLPRTPDHGLIPILLLLIFGLGATDTSSGHKHFHAGAGDPGMQLPVQPPQPPEPPPQHGDCMGTAQLQAVVQSATWHGSVDGTTRATVVLTTCDQHCMKLLFEPWMHAIEHARDGGFARHVIVVGNGLPAYTHCEALRASHEHHCLLDRMCMPPGAPELSGMGLKLEFLRPLYFLALVQKLLWAVEVLKLGVSVLWADMDIYFFANPMIFLIKAAPDADLVVQTEYWDHHTLFKGDVCKFAPHGAGCKDNQTVSSLHPYCCGMVLNGGLWLVNPTAAGSALLQTWAALMFENSVVMGLAWNSSALLDQTVLERMVSKGQAGARRYRWDEGQKQWVNHANVTRLLEMERVYRTSGQRTQSLCPGPCGWSGDNTGYDSYVLCAGAKRPFFDCPKDPERAHMPALGEQLVCAMPRRHADRMISMHMNCNVDSGYKRFVMASFMSNWTVDEAAYEQAAAADPKKRVFPDW